MPRNENDAMDNDTLDDEAGLALFFNAVRDQEVPHVSKELSGRVLADAAAVLADQNAKKVAKAQKKSIFMSEFWELLGGWRGASGLATAAAAGLWFGVAQPTVLADVSDVIWGETQSVSLFWADDVMAQEG